MVHNEKEIVRHALKNLAKEKQEDLHKHMVKAVSSLIDYEELARNLYLADISLDEYLNSLCVLVIEGSF